MLAVRLCVATGDDYVYRTFTCELKSNNSDKPFVSKATYPVNLGWKFIDISAKEKDKNEVDKLCCGDEVPDKIQRNSKYCSVPASVSEHFTSPPKQYTDATLLSAMETAGNTDCVEDSNVEKKDSVLLQPVQALSKTLLSDNTYSVTAGKFCRPKKAFSS